MTTAVQLQISIAGGAYATGTRSAAAGATLNMQTVGASQLTSIRYEIFDYPPGFTVPAGWSTDPVSGAYYFAPNIVTTAPPQVALSSALWGPYMLRVRGNSNPLRLNPDGSPNAAFNPGMTDESTFAYVLSPRLGMQGVGFGETTQRDAMRGWEGPLMQSLRAADSAASSNSTGWVTVCDIDFTAQSSQTLTTDGTYVIGADVRGNAITWTKANSTNDRVAMAVTNGTGLVQNAKPAAAYAGGGRTLPLVTFPFSTVLANFGFSADWQTQYRLMVYVTMSGGAANSQDYAVFGFDVGSNAWTQMAQWGVGPGVASNLSIQVLVAAAAYASNVVNLNTLGSSVQTVMLESPRQLEAACYAMTGAAPSASWPSYASLQPWCTVNQNAAQIGGIGGGSAGGVNPLGNPAPGNLTAFLGAFNGGDNPTITYKRVRLDVR